MTKKMEMPKTKKMETKTKRTEKKTKRTEKKIKRTEMEKTRRLQRAMTRRRLMCLRAPQSRVPLSVSTKMVALCVGFSQRILKSTRQTMNQHCLNLPKNEENLKCWSISVIKSISNKEKIEILEFFRFISLPGCFNSKAYYICQCHLGLMFL